MKFTIEFASENDVNLVLNSLAALPFAQVNQLVKSIESQAHKQEDAARGKEVGKKAVKALLDGAKKK